MWLTLLALRNRIGILMLSLAMVILGATSLQRLPVDLFPNIQVPVAFVGVIYKGAPPLDIEQSVVYPIEKAVSSASNVEHVESFAKQGIGAVQIWFNWGADINVGQMEVMQRITQILNSLPPGILQPFIVKFDVSNIPVAIAPGGGVAAAQSAVGRVRSHRSAGAASAGRSRARHPRPAQGGGAGAHDVRLGRPSGRGGAHPDRARDELARRARCVAGEGAGRAGGAAMSGAASPRGRARRVQRPWGGVHACALLAAVLVLGANAPAGADGNTAVRPGPGEVNLTAKDRPAALRDVGIDQRLGEQVPLDADVPRRVRPRRAARRLLRHAPVVLVARLLRVPDALHGGAERPGQRAQDDAASTPARTSTSSRSASTRARRRSWPRPRRRRYVQRYGRAGGRGRLALPHRRRRRQIKRADARRSASATPTTRQASSSRTPRGIVVLTPDGQLVALLLRHRLRAARPAARARRGVGGQDRHRRSTSCCSTASTTTRRPASTAPSTLNIVRVGGGR